MEKFSTTNRRRFLQKALLGSAALGSTPFPVKLRAAAGKTLRDPFHGLKVGIASYSLRKFSLDQAIAMTLQAGVKYINLKDVHLSLKSTALERQEARNKIEAAGLVLMGGGVIYVKNNTEEIRGIFDYAKESGMPTIVCSPDPAALDAVEKFAKEYHIRVAIHNHGPGDKLYPSPLDVLRQVKDRDPLLGICMDIGHTARIGEDPVALLGQCAHRLYDLHMKDVTEATAKGTSTEVGKGIIDVVAFLKTLVRLKYPYHVGLEYEANAGAPMPGIIESLAYMRGVLSTIE